MFRELLFLIGCIGSRTLLTMLSRNLNYLPYIGSVTLLMSLSFIYIYMFGSEMADRQLEWLGDKKIWWNKLRIIHGGLFLIFSVLAFMKYESSWMVLGLDTLIGLTAWIAHRFYKIDFN